VERGGRIERAPDGLFEGEESVEAILRTGQRFLAAKVACEHGEFGKLFDKDRERGCGAGCRRRRSSS